jgi:ribosomal protein S18 acetylase RimI-like enzyme
MADSVVIRAIESSLSWYLREALFASIHVPDDKAQPDVSILLEPHFAAVLEGWGRTGDRGVVAIDRLRGDLPVGAAWVRLYTKDRPAYGYLADDIPVLAVSVSIEHRGRGIGTRLMTALISQVRSGGHRAISLSVDPGNRALNLYRRLGFVTVMAPRLIANDQNPVFVLEL